MSLIQMKHYTALAEPGAFQSKGCYIFKFNATGVSGYKKCRLRYYRKSVNIILTIEIVAFLFVNVLLFN